MGAQFKVVGIMGKVKSPEVKETLQTLIQFLASIKQQIVLDAETAEALADPAYPCLPRTEFSQACDLIIVVGGDGSLLHAAQSAVLAQVPVLGINRGRLGFLTDILPNELQKIKTILAGEYLLEKRFLLDVKVIHEGKLLGQAFALNEAALIPDLIPHMNEFEVYIDDQFVCSQDSDGLIVATPTGSTAYALSGGGPILHPELDAMVIVPMFPHTLSMRPIVLQGDHQLTIKITENNETTPRLTCDGQQYINTPPTSEIHIHKKAQHLHLIHPSDYNYYATLRSKLHWGRKVT